MQSTENRRHPSKWNSVPVPDRVAERAYTKIDHIDDDGCWISAYSTASHGYAQVGWQDDGKRNVVLAHRAAWVYVHGQVPLGMTLDHTCKTRPCVNPKHLRMLPNFENARRTRGNDWPMGFCRNGHSNEYLIEVTRQTKSGGKRVGMACSECSREHQRRYREKNPNHVQEWRERFPENARKYDLARSEASKAKREQTRVTEIPCEIF